MGRSLIVLLAVAGLQACVTMEVQLDPWVGHNIDDLLSISKRSPDSVRDIGGRYTLYEWTVGEEKLDTTCRDTGYQVKCETKSSNKSCTIGFRVDDDGIIRSHEHRGDTCMMVRVVQPPT